MKRYLLFRGDVFYPVGGWHDFAGSFDTIQEARDKVIDKILPDLPLYSWWHVIDSQDGQEVAYGGRT